MPTPKIRADYQTLRQIAQVFSRESETARRTLQSVQRAKDALQAGDWRGVGATAFYREMDQDVLPSMIRLYEALDSAGQVTQKMLQILQDAEEEAASLLRWLGMAGFVGAGGILSGVDDAIGTALGHVGDFFVGLWEEGKDMVTGLYNMVTDPVGTAKGLWQAVTHPGLLWEALKTPYVEAWESGHPGQAIGRGVMFIGSILLGTKGADKIADAIKAARAARVGTEAVEVGTRTGSALNAAKEIGVVTRGSSTETALARYIATESTETFGTVDRVVLGGFEADPTRGFFGYLNEAEKFGGKVFNTGDDVWEVIGPSGLDRGGVVNMEFMQAQLEGGVGRFDITGRSVSEILNDPLRSGSGTADEIRFLQRYGYEYGYQQIGDSWVKTGGWRATTTGRLAGESVGPSLDVIEDASHGH
jgi:WXG100 family type VII secretion target